MNVHDARRSWWRNLDRWDRDAIRQMVGNCPFCASGGVSVFGLPKGTEAGVIYRTSRRSLTMRCSICGLQWTMTWVKIHQAMQHRIAHEGDREMAGIVAELAAPALANETRGRRKPEQDGAASGSSA